MSHLNVAVLIGSLRKGSFNRKVAMGLDAITPSGMTLTTIEIGDLPLYNPDLTRMRLPQHGHGFDRR